MKKANNSNKGFTLVELLAVFAILSVVMTIVVYTALNIIDNAKEKSYEATINNIQTGASNYVLESLSNSIWIDKADYQYQCVSVGNLIDAGYFKNDILGSYSKENTLIEESDYVYLERDINTKTIITNSFLSDDKYSALCSDSNNVTFRVEPLGWTNESKKVKIKYNLHYVDASDVSSYQYNSSFYSTDTNKMLFDYNKEYFTNSIVEEEVIVPENGNLQVNIYDNLGNVYSSDILVNKIDKIDPEGYITTGQDNNGGHNISMIFHDYESGLFGYYFGMTDPEVNNVGWNKLDDCSDCKMYGIEELSVDEPGKYYLGVKDVAGNVFVTSVDLYEVTFSIENATSQYDNIIVVGEKDFNLPNVTLDTNYKFSGWYTTEDYSSSVLGETYKTNENITLYGKVNRDRYQVHIKYSTGGNEAYLDSSNPLLSVNDNNIITFNGSEYVQSYDYGTTVDRTDGLADWDNDEWINIKKNGYSVWKDDEWVCSEDSECAGETFSDWDAWSVNEFCDASESDCTVVLEPNWKINQVHIKYYAGGTGVSVNSSSSTVSRNSSNIITFNGSEYVQSYDYGTTVDGTDGLANWDNANWIKIQKIKEGYSYIAVDGSEWKCMRGYECAGKTFSDSFVYDVSEFCDASEGDCTVVLEVNWLNKVKIKYSVGSTGAILLTYNQDFTVNNATKIIKYNDSDYVEVYDYGSILSSSGLANWDNENYISINRAGYVVVEGAEWKCQPGYTCSGKTFNDYSRYNVSEFCDASNGDCTIVLEPNWLNLKIEFSDPKIIASEGSYQNDSEWIPYVARSTKGGRATVKVSGDDISFIKYVYSTNKDASASSVSNSLSNGVSPAYTNGNGTYYLIVYTCNTNNQCNKQYYNNPFYLDNTAPTINCDNTKAWTKQYIKTTCSGKTSYGSNDVAPRCGEAYNTNDFDTFVMPLATVANNFNGSCSVQAIHHYYCKACYNYSACETLISSEDPYYSECVRADSCNDKGQCVTNGGKDGYGFSWTAGECKSGWCYNKDKRKVCDRAGNCVEKNFYYYMKFDSSW